MYIISSNIFTRSLRSNNLIELDSELDQMIKIFFIQLGHLMSLEKFTLLSDFSSLRLSSLLELTDGVGTSGVLWPTGVPSESSCYSNGR